MLTTPKTREWLQYFEQNAGNPLRIPGDRRALTPGERRRITRSIQSFQIGESSEGRLLLAAATKFAELEGCSEYPKVMRFLVREENRHSAFLAAFMRKHEIPLAQNRVTDRAFRFLRKLGGIELHIRVLVTAELIALAYYASLRLATESDSLRVICDRVLIEEKQHILFQMHHIHWMNAKKLPLHAALADIGHAFFLAGTLCVTWLEHRKVLQSRGGFLRFFTETWDEFREAMDRGRISVGLELEDAP